jgi:hypothetical protein
LGAGRPGIATKHIEDFVTEAYQRAAERIAAGEFKDDRDEDAEQA